MSTGRLLYFGLIILLFGIDFWFNRAGETGTLPLVLTLLNGFGVLLGLIILFWPARRAAATLGLTAVLALHGALQIGMALFQVTVETAVLATGILYGFLAGVTVAVSRRLNG